MSEVAVQLLLGAVTVVALVACGAGVLGYGLAEARRARAWERQDAGPRPSTGTGPLSTEEKQAWDEIARRLEAGRARQVTPRRRRPARKTRQKAGKR